jgi:hypothetical protein
MTRPCTCDRYDPSAPYTLDQCRVCWLYHNDPGYRALWHGNPTSPTRERGRSSCTHRGPELRRQPCRTCAGTVQLRIFHCALHAECTIGQQLPAIACCSTCQDYHEAR